MKNKKKTELPEEELVDNPPHEADKEQAKPDSAEVPDAPPNTEEQLREAEDKYLRLQAEFQNYKKRVEREKIDFMKFSTETFMLDLLPLMDNMERAQNAISESTDEKMKEGISLVVRSLEELFAKYELVKIEALGRCFDPDLHHAVLTEDAGEGEPDKVVLVLQEGYTLKGKVIRPSMVKVSK